MSKHKSRLWFMLHFSFSSRSYEKHGKKSAADVLIEDLKKVYPEYSKTKQNIFKILEEKVGCAIENAKKLEEANFETSSDNPSTKVHVLVDLLLNLRK